MDAISAERLEGDIRVSIYAAIELLLDMVASARAFGRTDLESILIYFTVVEASIRPLVRGRDIPPEVLDMPRAPNDLYGISTRRSISESLNLPRETVRRKLNALFAAGLLQEDDNGHIGVVSNLHRADIHQASAEVKAAVARYLALLQQYGVGLEK